MLRQLSIISETNLEPVEDRGLMSGFRSTDDNPDRLHILQRLITDPQNTWFFEAASDEMDLFGIKKGTLLVVDRSKKPSGGMIVIARYNGEWLLRQLITHPKKKYLSTGKEEDPMVEIKETEGPVIWGVVTWSCCPQMDGRQ